jgi:D-alanyl-D-alanine carboxypeptidase
MRSPAPMRATTSRGACGAHARPARQPSPRPNDSSSNPRLNVSSAIPRRRLRPPVPAPRALWGARGARADPPDGASALARGPRPDDAHAHAHARVPGDGDANADRGSAWDAQRPPPSSPSDRDVATTTAFEGYPPRPRRAADRRLPGASPPPPLPRRPAPRGVSFVAGVAFGAAYLALDLPGAFRRQAQSPDVAPLSAFASAGATRNPDASPSLSARLRRLLTARSAPSAPEIPDRAALVSAPAPSPPDVLFGHCRAEEAPRHALARVDAAGRVTLRRAAAEAFRRMARDALDDGVVLVPVSGFRSYERQERVFFDVAAARGQTPGERAKVSAPPGYSEHHTGYAVDISAPEMGDELSVEFERTAAFRWLAANAASHGFEMSFGRNHPLGVSYEPWHYRWVGDAHSMRTFAATVEATREAAAAGVGRLGGWR